MSESCADLMSESCADLMSESCADLMSESCADLMSESRADLMSESCLLLLYYIFWKLYCGSRVLEMRHSRNTKTNLVIEKCDSTGRNIIQTVSAIQLIHTRDSMRTRLDENATLTLKQQLYSNFSIKTNRYNALASRHTSATRVKKYNLDAQARLECASRTLIARSHRQP
jgi:hypothetical protein